MICCQAILCGAEVSGKGRLQVGWEHQSYMGRTVLGARSGFGISPELRRPLSAWTCGIILRWSDFEHYRCLLLFYLSEPAGEKHESGVSESFFDAFGLT